jgi:transcriptional regulator with PAS, ATPase and Fis domain
MTESYRGGNSRLLAKTLDQMGNPVAILDRRGAIAFVNAALCALVQADATLLVGQHCSWQIATDDNPFASLLTSLAPPAGALQGRIVSRQLTTPIVFGSTHTGQLFVPLLDIDGSVEALLVVLGMWEDINAQLPTSESGNRLRSRQWESVLVDMRSRWQTLDGLHALLGTSPAIQLAMTRAQLASGQAGSVLVCGPPGSGKSDVVRGIFLARLKRLGLSKLAGQLFPIHCGLLEPELLDGTLELLAGRLTPELAAEGQLLLLEHLDQLDNAGVQRVQQWLDDHAGNCTLAATSGHSSESLAARGPTWSRLVSRLAAVEIHAPPLRQRREDIPILATQLLAASCQQKGRAVLSLSSDAIDLLTAFPWPENLQQLTQAMDEAVKHAVLVSSVQPQHLPVVIRTFASTALKADAANLAPQPHDKETLAPEWRGLEPIDIDEILLELERTILMRALRLSPRNRAQAARLLGISRTRLLRRIEQLGINSP